MGMEGKKRGEREDGRKNRQAIGKKGEGKN
jgi:hypothetical protein